MSGGWQDPGLWGYALLGAVGLVVGAVVNLGVYALGWESRPLSPWQRGAADDRRRSMAHRWPVLGWWCRRHEAAEHGRWFWLRPFLLEVAWGALFVVAYRWVVVEAGWFGPLTAGELTPISWRVAEFVGLMALVSFMAAASLIDLDEKNIPDGVTLPGTLLALVLAVVVPWGRTPEPLGGEVPVVAGVLHLASPASWPGALGGAPQSLGLVLGLAGYAAWCFALLPRVWRGRRGWGLAWRIFAAHLARERFTRFVAGLWLVGSAAVLGVWWWGGDRWVGMLSAMVGLVAGGGTIWAVRLAGRVALGREAMGFGDVTLMAMIGAFLGWQPSVFVFFFAPFLGLLLGGVQWALGRGPEIPYGPFLCLAAGLVIVRWPELWWRYRLYFQPWWLIPVVAVVMSVLLAVTLAALAVVRRAMGRD